VTTWKIQRIRETERSEEGFHVHHDLDETTVVAMAGTHDLANPALTESTFCGALRLRRAHHRAASAPAAR
jgi:hypothetical protein